MSEHSSHHKHHHKRRLKIPKNAIIITLAVLFSIALFILVIHQINNEEEESPEQYEIIEVADSLATSRPAETASSKTEPPKTTKSSVPESTVSWCALGDSITYGYYSTTDPDSGTTLRNEDRENIGWPFLVAKKNNWSLTNLAIAGEGYLTPASDDSGTCGYQQARKTDFTPYNLVTVSLGISDWISDCPMGSMEDDPSAETITAFIPAMRATIEAIATSNPMCKIIVILPLNTNGYEHNYGTKDTNWAIGYEMSNSGTLKQFTEKMIEVCELYGIQYINITTQSCINSISLTAMLPDGVHPTAETHNLLALELAEKITFKK